MHINNKSRSLPLKKRPHRGPSVSLEPNSGSLPLKKRSYRSPSVSLETNSGSLPLKKRPHRGPSVSLEPNSGSLPLKKRSYRGPSVSLEPNEVPRIQVTSTSQNAPLPVAAPRLFKYEDIEKTAYIMQRGGISKKHDGNIKLNTFIKKFHPEYKNLYPLQRKNFFSNMLKKYEEKMGSPIKIFQAIQNSNGKYSGLYQEIDKNSTLFENSLRTKFNDIQKKQDKNQSNPK